MTAILDIPSDQYHADKLDDKPTLSASIAKILCAATPAHAKAAHPRLNPDLKKKEEEKFDVGTASHLILLEGVSKIEVIVANDWKKQATRDLRDEARAAGLIPLLSAQAEDVVAMVEAAKVQLAAHSVQPPLFVAGGKAEQTLVWDEDGVVCRARPDWLLDDNSLIADYKTAHNANPEKWSKRALFDNGYDIQCALYLRGIQKISGVQAKWLWVVQEKTPPYVLSIVRPGADVLAVGAAKVQRAIDLWRGCLERDEWPGYSTSVFEAELPAWADDAKWLVDEYRSAA